MYNPHSLNALEFIDHAEILSTIAYADSHKSDANLIHLILEKARLRKGLSYREASVLLACDLEDKNEEIYLLAKQIKDDFYGNRVVLFAPLYLSNYCINSCVYCPYHLENESISRKKLTQDELRAEVVALQDMGHKRLALEMGEHPEQNPLEYILECIETIYAIKHKNGAIRRLNVNIAATSVENYRRLHEAQIGTYILFQETYNKENYERLHKKGPKHDYVYHTEAMDRAMQGGIDDVGLGVLFGLDNYAYEFTGLLMHAEHLEAVYGVGPHTISVPRICDGGGIDKKSFSNAIGDEIFAKIVACIRIAVPYTGIIVSTRESQACREKVLALGVSQVSGASKTSVGGYVSNNLDSFPDIIDINDELKKTAQFELSDERTLDEIVRWLMELGYLPSFCTACYASGRTGDRFMDLCKSQQIQNCCLPNALITLKEYLTDYASDFVRNLGEKIIAKHIDTVTNEKTKKVLIKNLEEIVGTNKRNFRF